MQLKSIATALLGLAALASAQTADFDPISSPGNGQEVPVGSVLDIIWQVKEPFTNGNVKLHLIGGQEQNLQVPLYDIASGIPNSAGHYSWTVPTSEFGKPFYGIVITWLNDPSIIQYSMPFKVVSDSNTPEPTSSSSSSYSDLPTSSVEETSYTTSPPATTYTSHPTNQTMPTSTPCEEDSTSVYVDLPTPIPEYPANNTAPIYEHHTSSVLTSYVPGPSNYPMPAVPQPPSSSPIPGSGAGKVQQGASIALVGAFALAVFAI